MSKNKENFFKKMIPFAFLSKGKLQDVIDNAVSIAQKEATDWDKIDAEEQSAFLENIATGYFTEGSVFEQSSKAGRNKTYKYKIGYEKKGGKLKPVTEKISEATYINLGLNSGINPDNIQTLGKLRLAQDASLWQWINFPVGKSIIESTKRYVIGKGIKIDIPHEDISKVCKAMWKGNGFELGTKDDFRDYLIDGEILYSIFVNEDCKDAEKEPCVYLRRLPSSQIEEVEYDPEDYKTKLSYKRTYTKDGEIVTIHYLDFAYKNDVLEEAGLVYNPDISDSQYEVEATGNNRVAMFMNGTTFDERGRPFMECILRWNRILTDFVYDRGRLNHLRTKVFLIETRTAKGGRTLGSSSGISNMPKGGTKLIESADRKFRMVDPQTGASDAYTDYKIILYIIASGVSMPMHIINMNAENENYASIRQAGHPFIQMIEDFRDTWAEYVRQILRYTIAIAVEQGHLEKTYKLERRPSDTIGEMSNLLETRLKQGIPVEDIINEAEQFKKDMVEINAVDIPINIIFPELTEADPKVLAETLEVQMRNGIVSRKTAMQKSGYNVEAELIQIDIEQVKRNKEEDERIKKAMDTAGRDLGSNKE